VKHSRIGPSRAALIWHCTGSVQAEDAAGRPPAGEAAERGTALHAVAEILLRNGEATTAAPPEVRLYVDEVRRIATAAGAAPLIEQRLSLTRHHPEMFGTADVIIINLKAGVLTVADFKSGFHHVAADALQLRLYAGMAYLRLKPSDARQIRRVETVIVQPNETEVAVRHAIHRVTDILQTLGDYIDQAHIATGAKESATTIRSVVHRLFLRRTQRLSGIPAAGSARSPICVRRGGGRRPALCTMSKRKHDIMNDNAPRSTKVVLRNVRLAYAMGLYQAKSFQPGQPAKYGCTCLLPPGHPAVDLIEDALVNAAMVKWGPRKNWPKRLRGLTHEPVLKSVADFEKLQTGSVDDRWAFVRASSQDEPAIVDANVDPVIGGDLRRECYSGRWANVSVNAFGYEQQTGAGVTLGLNSVQLLRHDDRLGAGRPRPEDDYQPESLDSANDDYNEEEEEELAPQPRHRTR
jgi:hypothetical protein